jgi:hypothetical protein
MKIWIIISIYLVGFLVINCSNQSQKILGKWENKESRTTFEFKSDGKYSYAGSGDIRMLYGPYQIENNHLQLTALLPDKTTFSDKTVGTFEFKVESDVLILKPLGTNLVTSTTNFSSMEFRRIPQ